MKRTNYQTIMKLALHPLGVLFGVLAAGALAQAQNWNQGGGPNGNWKTAGENPPTSWSASTDDQILWRTTLPESGQGSVIVWRDRAFVTANSPWSAPDRAKGKAAAIGKDIDGYCLNSATGEILWQVRLPGTRAKKYAGPFSDSTAPSPVTDGQYVWFFNCSGMIGCYDFDGKEVWSYSWTPRGLMANRQFEPMLIGDVILNVEVMDKSTVVDTSSLNDGAAIKALKNGIDQKHFTFIHAYDKLTGELKWVSEDPTSVHSASCLGITEDGELALLHRRGGGHHPIESPHGLSLTSLASGSEGRTQWQYQLKTGSPYTHQWNSKYASWWGKGKHLVLDAGTGKLISEHSLTQNTETETSLASFVLEDGRQDSILIRPTVWSVLTFLRIADPGKYRTEIEMLFANQPRLHLRFLLIEFICRQPKPLEFEVSLIGERLLNVDQN